MRWNARAVGAVVAALVLALTAGTGSAPTGPAAAAMQAPKEQHAITWEYPPKFSNVTINVVGDAGHNLAPYEFWMDHLPKAGISIKIIEVPFEGVYEKEKTEFVAGSGAFDVVTFYPAYIGDFASNGYLEPLDEYMRKQPDSAWNPHQEDVLPPFRELYNKWAGKTYALTIDGDAHMLIYRKDLFADPGERAAFKAKYGKDLRPPQTWDDWLQVGAFFTRKKGQKLAGQTLDRDFYGSAEFAKRGFSFAWFVDRWAASGELYFDDTMKPQINTPTAVAALQNFVDSLKNAPPDVRGYGYDELRDALLKGNVAMVVQWTDVPKKGADPSESQVVGKLGVGRVPGLSIGGRVNHRAMMPVGRVVAVAASSKNKDAAYWVANHVAYDTSLENVSTFLTGLDSYRASHLAHPEAYTMFKNAAEARVYLDGLKVALADGYPEIFIPGAAQYEDALDLHVNKALAGQETPKQALDAVAQVWNAITQRLGQQKQVELWRQALKSYQALGLVK